MLPVFELFNFSPRSVFFGKNAVIKVTGTN